MSYLDCFDGSSAQNRVPAERAAMESPEKYAYYEWLMEPTPKIPKSEAIALPSLSLLSSADESDRLIVRRNSVEHKAYYKAQQASLRVNLPDDGGHGSGFLISPDGLAVTASHVVPKGLARIDVNRVDGTKYSAELIARDVNNDLALIKISSKDNSKFPFLTLNTKDAHSEKLAATGHPYGWPSMYISMGLGHSTSKAAPQWKNADELLPFITHAAGGNSGGAVIDGCATVRGVMVGGGFKALGAAIPSKSVEKLVRWTEQAKSAGINNEGGYNLAEFEVKDGKKESAAAPEAKRTETTKENAAPKPELKIHKPGSFKSPYGNVYTNPMNYYEQKQLKNAP